MKNLQNNNGLMLKWYVYALCYPDGTPFYIGKGTGKRMDSHESRAKSGKTGDCLDIIRSILNDGKQIVKNIYLQTDSEDAAFQEERRLIHYHSQLHRLANKVSGSSSSKPSLAQEMYDYICTCPYCTPETASYLVRQSRQQ